MLSQNEKNYLKTISKSKKVRIYKYDVKVQKVADDIIEKINKIAPELEVKFIGAQALKISGQKDIDINILCEPNNFKKYLQKLMQLFKIPSFMSKNYIGWNFKKSGYDIELYLTNPNSKSLQRQIKVFEILNNNPKLLKEYEDFKQAFNGKSYYDYQKAKYEFYNKIIK